MHVCVRSSIPRDLQTLWVFWCVWSCPSLRPILLFFNSDLVGNYVNQPPVKSREKRSVPSSLYITVLSIGFLTNTHRAYTCVHLPGAHTCCLHKYTHTGDRNREQHVRKTTHSLSRVCETIHLCELHDLTHLRRACECVRRLAAEERRTPAGLSHLNRAQQPIDKSHTALQTLCPSKPAPASGHRPTRCARVPFISGRGNYHYASCI